jgi:hypothetical protein
MLDIGQLLLQKICPISERGVARIGCTFLPYRYRSQLATAIPGITLLETSDSPWFPGPSPFAFVPT